MASVWQISVVVYDTKSIITGVVLKTKLDRQKNKLSLFSNLFKLAKSYAVSALKNSEITLKINDKEYHTKTNESGSFKTELDFPLNSEPSISLSYQNKELEINQNYPLFFKSTTSKYSVISDIDDTIIVSYTASVLKRISTAALVAPHKRKIIKFTGDLINCLKNSNANIFYVSKSESNLFGILSAYIVYNKLPKGLLFLTPYLNYPKLLSGKKPKDYKINIIKSILENQANNKFILFGDDTQKDMEIYTSIAKQFPTRIERIYIRQTRPTINNKKQGYWDKLKSTFPDSIYFNKETDLEKELLILENLL